MFFILTHQVSILSFSIIHISWLWGCQALSSDNSELNQEELGSLIVIRDKLLRVCQKILEIQYNSEMEGLADFQRAVSHLKFLV